MTDNGIQSAAALIMMGLILNGCLNAGSISEVLVVDEDRIAEGMEAMGCNLSGRTWFLGRCRDD